MLYRPNNLYRSGFEALRCPPTAMKPKIAISACLMGPEVRYNGGSRGIYTQAFCALHPDLPVEEEGRLNDPVLRDNFLTRVFAYNAWQQLLQTGLTRRGLTDFHSRYKYLLMAHNPVQYKTLGNLLGNMGQTDLEVLGPRYFSELMAALKKMRHTPHPHQRAAASQRLSQTSHQP